MELINNSTIDTVIDFANVKFGMELTKDQVSAQLRNLSFSETLKLINSIKADDNDAFSSIIDLSAVSEGWSVLPSIDREKYQERDGLEGPIQTKIGKTLYSPQTQVRNVSSASLFALMNGHIGGKASVTNAMKIAFDDIFGAGKQGVDEVKFNKNQWLTENLILREILEFGA